MSLQNHILSPTFKRSPNTLDLVIDSYCNPLITEPTVCAESSFSDHCLISFGVKVEKEDLNKRDKVITFREYNEENISNGYRYLTEALNSYNSINTVVELDRAFKHILFTLRNEHFPAIQKTIKVSNQNPWYNGDCHKSKLLVRNKERFYRKNKSVENWLALKAAEKASLMAVKKAKKDFYTSIFSIVSSNPKKTYNIVSDLLGKAKAKTLPDLAITDPGSYVEIYNNFLASKIKVYRNQSENSRVGRKVFSSPIDYEPLNRFPEINSADLHAILKRCRKTHCDLDLIEFKKLDMKYFIPYIIRLANSMFNSGVFPPSEKSAIIYPYIKDFNGDVNDLSNYRPVSNISFIGKVLEACIYFFLNEYVSVHNILPDYQSAYRPGYSTETALTRVYSDLVTSKDNRRCTIMLSLDLSSAFDTIDHDLLITDLFHVGVRGRALDLITSYLRGRSVAV